MMVDAREGQAPEALGQEVDYPGDVEVRLEVPGRRQGAVKDLGEVVARRSLVDQEALVEEPHEAPMMQARHSDAEEAVPVAWVEKTVFQAPVEAAACEVFRLVVAAQVVEILLVVGQVVQKAEVEMTEEGVVVPYQEAYLLEVVVKFVKCLVAEVLCGMVRAQLVQESLEIQPSFRGAEEEQRPAIADGAQELAPFHPDPVQ